MEISKCGLDCGIKICVNKKQMFETNVSNP